MENKSIWLKDITLNKKGSNTTKDLNVDILIIGGGIAGMTTAFNLNNCKKSVCLIDKSYIGLGVTSCSTGKLTFLQSDMLYKIKQIHGFDIAKGYLDATKNAIQFVKNLVQKYNIDCDFKIVPSYLYSCSNKEELILDETMDFLSKANEKYKSCNDIPLPFNIKRCIEVENTAIFNPVKYVRSLKEMCTNIKFIENIIATNITKDNDFYIVKTDKNTIMAKKVIVTTHYPFFITPGLIPFKTHLERSYIVAFKDDKYQGISGINIKKPIFSIRSHKDNYVLYSSCSHKMSNDIDYEERYQEIINDATRKFNSKIDYAWMTHDITTNDILPFIGKINESEQNLLIATGFNKWGMTNGTIAGMLLSDIALDKKNKYESMFNPTRSINLARIGNFLVDTFNTAKIYFGTKLVKNHSFYNRNVYVENRDGISCGVYIDDNNKKHIVKNICPHMKCRLIFNNFDKTWDCPCHGSRFDIDGNVLEGPSCYNIKLDDETF